MQLLSTQFLNKLHGVLKYQHLIRLRRKKKIPTNSESEKTKQGKNQNFKLDRKTKEPKDAAAKIKEKNAYKAVIRSLKKLLSRVTLASPRLTKNS